LFVLLQPGMTKPAAFFETRRFAAYKGATTEFSKWEGAQMQHPLECNTCCP
jgi:hypothetical protein